MESLLFGNPDAAVGSDPARAWLTNRTGPITGSDQQRGVGTDDGGGTSQPRATGHRRPRGLDFRRRARLWQRQDHVPAVFVAVAAALAIAAAAPAQEYDPPIRTLVKNADAPSERVVLLNANQDGLNQAFRTGPNTGGYELTSIVLHVHDTHESRYMTLDAGIYLWDESGFTPVAELTGGRLNDYAANEWRAPANTYLEPDTEYYFLLDCTAGCANDNMAQFLTTYSGEEDPGAEEGWDIHDHLGFRTAGDPSWKWDARLILRIEVKGRPSYHRAYRTEIASTPASGDTYLVGENIDIALTFNTPVYVPEGQSRSSIGIQVGNVARQAAYLSGTFTTRLIYRYEVRLDDVDANGISVDEGGPDTGFVGFVPTLVASLGLWPVDRYYPGVADDPGHKVDGSVNCTVLEDGSVHCVPGSTARLSVADARTTEGADATLEFAVTLDRASSQTVTVDYATADGSAQAGQDYTAATGTLTFAPGETEKTVSVGVLDDAHDEGEETLTLTLSNASGARIADDVGTGTIENADPLQRAWLARFGRTAAQRILDGVQARLEAPREAGVRATFAGHSLGGPGEEAAFRAGGAGMAARDRFAAVPGRFSPAAAEGRVRPRQPALRDLATGSGFTLSGPTGGGLGTLWGRGSYSAFRGSAEALALDGGVATGMVGADYAIGGWVLGLPLAVSLGDGHWQSPGREGRMASSLSGLYPYAGYRLSQRLSLWGTAGYGQGDLTLTMKDGESYRTGLDLRMAAAGLRGDLLSVGPEGGPSLAVESDALFLRTASDAASGPSGLLAAAAADVSRLRIGLEGSLELALDGGQSLRPAVELGLRHDGGDAETGLGLEIGGGSGFTDAARGLTARVAVRGLVAHQTSGFRDWGISGFLRFDPRPSSDLGPSVALTPSWGAPSTGGVEALFRRETLSGLAVTESASPGGRLDAETAYGFAVLDGRATGTPYLGVGRSEALHEVRVGCRLERPRRQGLALNLEGTRLASGDAAPEHGVTVRLALR